MKELLFPVKRSDHFMIPDAMFKTPARRTHGGVDLTPVVQNKPEPFYSPEPGQVVISSFVAATSGHNIMVLGAWTGIRWWGGHLSRRDVAVGTNVARGTQLGMTGTTGFSSGVHLHLEAHHPRINDEIDPWLWLWDAPDITGSLMPLAPTRDKALAVYPKFEAKPPAPPKPADPLPIKETDMARTLKYRRRGAPEVVLVNPIEGFAWHIPSKPYLGYVDALGLADDDKEVELPDDQFRLLLQITAEGKDREKQLAFIDRLYNEANKKAAKAAAPKA